MSKISLPGIMASVVFVAIMLISTEAKAVRDESYNLIVLDGAGNVIGQHAEFCNNYQYEGGQMQGANVIEIVTGCSQYYATNCQLIPHSNDFATWSCEEGVYNTITVTENYAGSYGVTAEWFCNTYSPICKIPDATLLPGHGFDLVQIWPTP